jgi:hypothetical protein
MTPICQIAGNFVLNIVEAELRPADASDVAKFLVYSNMTLTYMFAVELVINLFANLLWEFVADGSSCSLHPLIVIAATIIETAKLVLHVPLHINF